MNIVSTRGNLHGPIDLVAGVLTGPVSLLKQVLMVK